VSRHEEAVEDVRWSRNNGMICTEQKRGSEDSMGFLELLLRPNMTKPLRSTLPLNS
jgi:hypothetical protein